MRRLKIVAADVISEGASHWLYVIFEGHPKKLCFKISDPRGGKAMAALFGPVKDSSELPGRVFFAADLPRRSNEFCCWEKIKSKREGAV